MGFGGLMRFVNWITNTIAFIVGNVTSCSACGKRYTRRCTKDRDGTKTKKKSFIKHEVIFHKSHKLPFVLLDSMGSYPPSAAVMASPNSLLSGVVPESKRAKGLPSLPIKIFPKFHFTSPGNAPPSPVRAV